jgi:thiol-disulfide isomerase/thioredoxin
MDLSGSLSLGPFTVPLRLLAVAAVLAAAIVVARIPLARHRRLRSLVTDRLANAIVIFVVVWKLAPAALNPAELFRDPLPLLMGSPGLPGVIAGALAGAAYLAISILRHQGLRRAAVVPLLIFVGVSLLGIGAMEVASLAPPASLSPSPRAAPELSLPTLDGPWMSLDALRGKVVIVNFWATWCPPCRAELPALAAFARAQGAGGTVLLGVNATTSEQSEETVRAFVGKHGLDFAVLLDRSGEASETWGVRAYPTTFVIDRYGGVSAERTGAVDPAWLRRETRAAARRPDPSGARF